MRRVAELSPTRIRGMLVASNELSITVGIFVSFVIAYAVARWAAWRLLFLLCAVPASIQMVRCSLCGV
jgi:MFS family permease